MSADVPYDLVFDAQGNLYVSFAGTPSGICKYSHGGAYLGLFANMGGNVPHGLAFDTAGNLYAAFVGTPCGVHEFGPAGADLGNFVITGANVPTGIAFDVSGNLYVGYSGTPSGVFKFGPNGTSFGTFASIGLNAPAGLAIRDFPVTRRPTILASDASFGVISNRFGFDVGGEAGLSVVVEGSCDLLVWTALMTNILGAGPFHFIDTEYTNFPSRFYRARGQ